MVTLPGDMRVCFFGGLTGGEEIDSILGMLWMGTPNFNTNTIAWGDVIETEDVLFAMALFMNNSQLEYFGGATIVNNAAIMSASAMKSINLACPAGSFSPNIFITPCALCSKGSYSTQAGSSSCVPCTAGLTTASVGQTSLQACAVCEEGTCGKHGKCFVSGFDQSIT